MNTTNTSTPLRPHRPALSLLLALALTTGAACSADAPQALELAHDPEPDPAATAVAVAECTAASQRATMEARRALDLAVAVARSGGHYPEQEKDPTP